MPDPLGAVWERSDVEAATFSADEVRACGSDAVALLARAGLVRRIENARCIPCDACAEHHVEEITYVESPRGSAVRAYIHCPEHGRVAVPLERLEQWGVNFDGLAAAAAKGLDLAGDMQEVVRERLWSLGKMTIGGRSRGVFLARGATWMDAPGVFGPCEQLNASRGALLLVPGDVPPNEAWTGSAVSIVPLKLVARLEASHLAFDRDHLESLLTRDQRKAPIKAQQSFPTPHGTAWREVMVWITDSTITIEAKRLKRDFTFAAAGFEEKRRGGVPDGIWSLLKIFAMRGGEIPYDGQGLDRKTRTNLKQYVAQLRKRLRALIPGIDGDPVPHDREGRCYRMSFHVATQDGVAFPVPSGVEWTDVTITLTRGGAIRISVPATERFAASTYAEEGDADIHRWDPAERESESEREYDLRMLGLVSENGVPDATGAALMEVLRASGAVCRPADDDAMLELCGVLTKLMAGIEGSPFDYAPASQKWVALFDARNER